VVERILRPSTDTYFYFFAIAGINMACSVHQYEAVRKSFLHDDSTYDCRLLHSAPALVNLLYPTTDTPGDVFHELVADTWLHFDVVRPVSKTVTCNSYML
jgi:hypothetical protein